MQRGPPPIPMTDGGEREGVQPLTPLPTAMKCPPGQPPASPAACNAQQGRQAKAPVPGPDARTPGATTCGQRFPAACPKDRKRGGGQCLSSDAHHDGRGRHSRGCPPATPTARKPALKSARCRAGAGPPAPLPAPGKHGQRAPAACSKDGKPGGGERRSTDTPHNGEKVPPLGISRHPCGTQAPTGHRSQRASAGSPRLHTRTHSMWAVDPSYLPPGRAAGEDERLASDAPLEDTRLSPW